MTESRYEKLTWWQLLRLLGALLWWNFWDSVAQVEDMTKDFCGNVIAVLSPSDACLHTLLEKIEGDATADATADAAARLSQLRRHLHSSAQSRGS